MTVEGRYGVTFGKLDSSDWIDWEIELDEDEEAAYYNAFENDISPNDVPELQDALQRAYEEIEEEEIQMGLDNEDEYVMECQGEAEMDPEELNDLVAARDPHALEFFGLDDADDDEIDDWDANDLDEIPLIKDFVEDFEPYSPYDEGWTLNVEFTPFDEIDEFKIKTLLKEISNNSEYDKSVFEATGIYFIVYNNRIYEISDDAGCSPKGGGFPDIVLGPSDEEYACIQRMKNEIDFNEGFFTDMIEDCGEFDDEDAIRYFEENEDEQSLDIYRKIKSEIESGKTPFADVYDFVDALGRCGLDSDSLYYEWEGEYVDLYDNIAEWGEEWGTYDSLSESDWLNILEDIDDYKIGK